MSTSENLAEELEGNWESAAEGSSCGEVFGGILSALGVMEELAQREQTPVPFDFAFRNVEESTQRLADLGCVTVDQAARLSTFIGGARAAMANHAHEDALDKISRVRNEVGRLRGEEKKKEVRDDICGEVTRAVLAATGESCTRRSVDEVAEQLNSIRDVRVDRWEPAERQADDRDFIDLTITRGPSGGRMFLILTRNGFVPEALAGNWQGGTPEGEEGRVVLQFKR